MRAVRFSLGVPLDKVFKSMYNRCEITVLREVLYDRQYAHFR